MTLSSIRTLICTTLDPVVLRSIPHLTSISLWPEHYAVKDMLELAKSTSHAHLSLKSSRERYRRSCLGSAHFAWTLQKMRVAFN